eukprot:TRINITY_DN16738_c0_g1_i1.p1 TRINITY_DN16738_c0_g1~~TRINITY_DN16738_c0_g1_i1.p1  ORF type:complete len:280 (+),score=22.56 TRINITY_DN16738_c0_g1_i1:70-840(+)
MGSCCCGGLPPLIQSRRRGPASDGSAEQSRASEWPVPTALKSAMLRHDAGARSMRSRRSLSVSFAALEVSSIHEVPDEDRRGTLVPDQAKVLDGARDSVASSSRIVVVDVMEDFVHSPAPADESTKNDAPAPEPSKPASSETAIPSSTPRGVSAVAVPPECHTEGAVVKELARSPGMEVASPHEAAPAAVRKFSHSRVRSVYGQSEAPQNTFVAEKNIEDSRCGLGLEAVHVQQTAPAPVRKFTHSRARTVYVHGA